MKNKVYQRMLEQRKGDHYNILTGAPDKDQNESANKKANKKKKAVCSPVSFAGDGQRTYNY